MVANGTFFCFIVSCEIGLNVKTAVEIRCNRIVIQPQCISAMLSQLLGMQEAANTPNDLRRNSRSRGSSKESLPPQRVDSARLPNQIDGRLQHRQQTTTAPDRTTPDRSLLDPIHGDEEIRSRPLDELGFFKSFKETANAVGSRNYDDEELPGKVEYIFFTSSRFFTLLATISIFKAFVGILGFMKIESQQ